MFQNLVTQVKMGHPAISGLFFQAKVTIFTTNICEKCPLNLRYWDLKPQPIERVSSHDH